MMNDTSKKLLIVFIKNPRKGAVKRRIANELGDEAALEIYRALLKKTLNATRTGDHAKAVFYSEEIETNDIWPEEEYSKHLQEGTGMGQRMMNAFKTGFQQGFRKIVLVGGDIVNLDPGVIAEAFDALEDEKAVLGPATDGGYYLIGMKSMQEFIFRDKEWGQKSVFKDTCMQLQQKGFEVVVLEERSDVDTVDDFLKFYEKIFDE